MRFLPFIKGQDFLIIYAIFGVVGIIMILKLLKDKESRDFIISDLDEEKYYVLKHDYNLNSIFYYITYKLYLKGILSKDEEENKFYVNKDVSTYLSPIEEQVYILYLDKFSPKDFKSSMVNEVDFKNYYDNIYKELKANGLIRDNKMIKESKHITRIGMLIIFVPGIWRLIGGIVHGMPVTGLIIEIIIILIISIITVSAFRKGRLTDKGRASMNAYEKYHRSIRNNNNSENYNDVTSTNTQDFLMTNSWMYFLGVSDSSINRTNSNFTTNNNSVSSCSSCSSSNSCSSCSSGSSCSSCGGCGGGD